MKKKTKMKKRPSNFLDLIVNWSGITMSQKNGPLSMFLIGYFGTFNLYFEFFDKKIGTPYNYKNISFAPINTSFTST